MTPIYQDVRQWLSAQRQANGGHLAGLDGTDNTGSLLLILAAAAAILWLAGGGRTNRKR